MPKNTDLSSQHGIDICGIYRYGSNTSDDIDLFIAITRPPETAIDKIELKELRDMVGHVIREQMGNTHKPVDHSFVFINDEGIIEWCEYDDLEECNNALFFTFNHHEYNNVTVGVNPILKKLPQNVSFKIIKLVRQLLTYLSRTEFRQDVKYLLKEGSFKERLEFVLGIVNDNKLSSIGTFNKKLNDTEILKDITFGFIQLYSLIDGVDVFCKKDACLRFPDLAAFILKDDKAEWKVIESFILETFNMLSMNMEIFDTIDAVRYIGDEKACLNKEERILDHDIKQLK